MLAGIVGLLPQTASAVPSYARQTGMACATCHTVFPELTPFGRSFKLSGYTLTTTPTVEDKSQAQGGLSLNTTPPLSIMFQVSLTSTRKAQPDTQNSTVLFPQQLSLFYAGRITPKIGAFLQVTYDGNEDKFSMDNADIRFADKTELGGNPFTYGLTLNNAPTVQDLWNTTPVWGYPYSGSSVAPTPAAATMLDGALAQQSAGLGAYSAYHLGQDMAYAEFTVYRSAFLGSGGALGSSPTTSDVIQDLAPYVRLAYEHDWNDNSWQVGLLGMRADTYPTGTIPNAGTAADTRTDFAVDTQFQRITGDHIYSLQAIHIQEKQEWGAATPASNPSDKLKTTRVTGAYYYKHMYGGMLQYFDTYGDADAGLYTTNEPFSNSTNGVPDSRGAIGELIYMPWENTRFALQYTHYSKFNGGGNNYDGFGRNHNDNNTTYLVGWFMW